MSITLELNPELEARLRSEAERRGTPVESLLQTWIEENTEGQAAENGVRRPFYEAASREEWLREFRRWGESHPVAQHRIPDEAFSRENLYEDRW